MEEGLEVQVGVTQITRSPSLPSLPHCGLVVVVLMSGGQVSVSGPHCLGSPPDKTERKCHSPQAHWANLDSAAESC